MKRQRRLDEPAAGDRAGEPSAMPMPREEGVPLSCCQAKYTAFCQYIAFPVFLLEPFPISLAAHKHLFVAISYGFEASHKPGAIYTEWMACQLDGRALM